MTTTVKLPATTTAQARKAKSWRLWVGGLVLLLLIAAGAMIYRMRAVPDDLDYSTTQRSAQGLYEVSYSAEITPIPINQMLQWTLHVEDAAGQLVEDAQIAVAGDMPQHGHGLPTLPQVTRYLGDGDYLVEGLKFHMPGWWVVDFQIQANGQQDQVRFNLLLQ
jgi:hypothetical protein